jgi:hypothetical protein
MARDVKSLIKNIESGRYRVKDMDWIKRQARRGMFADLPQEEGEIYTPRQRDILNITYQVNDVDTPAFKNLQEQINQLNGRLSKYFANKGKHSESF